MYASIDDFIKVIYSLVGYYYPYAPYPVPVVPVYDYEYVC